MGIQAVVEPRSPVEPTKVCGRCHERKPYSEFYLRRAVGIPQSYCKRCSVATAIQRQARNPEGAKAAQARKYRNAKADPERAAIYRAYSRDSQRRRNGIPPERWRRSKYMTSDDHSPTVDAAPFVAWLRTLGDNAYQIAAGTGMPDGTVRALLRGDRTEVYLDTVDAAVLYANTLTTLDDLYPLENAA